MYTLRGYTGASSVADEDGDNEGDNEGDEGSSKGATREVARAQRHWSKARGQSIRKCGWRRRK